MNHFYKIFLFIIISILSISQISAQSDSTRKVSFSGIPVLASSPETGFKYGVFGQLSFDVFKNNMQSRPSQVRLGATYSVKKQLSIETNFLLFGKNESFFIAGNIDFQNWFDRHYGLGNDASNQIVEYRFGDETTIDTLNYLNYGLDIFASRISYNKKIRKGLFVGATIDYFNGSDFSITADSSDVPTNEIIASSMVGQYLGLGLSVTYDTRDNVNNPLKGTFVQLTNMNYRKWLGSDFEFYNLSLDARKYFNVLKDQTFAMRMLIANTASNDVIPYRGYQRLGGKEILRGYYNGTYLDKNLVAFDAEYRLPLFQDDSAPVYKIWKHLGVVGFVSAGQVYNDLSAFSLSEFRFSAGGGLRILLNKEQRTNIRLDYGFGFQENAAGLGRKQRGFYITVNEAF